MDEQEIELVDVKSEEDEEQQNLKPHPYMNYFNDLLQIEGDVC